MFPKEVDGGIWVLVCIIVVTSKPQSFQFYFLLQDVFHSEIQFSYCKTSLLFLDFVTKCSKLLKNNGDLWHRWITLMYGCADLMSDLLQWLLRVRLWSTIHLKKWRSQLKSCLWLKRCCVIVCPQTGPGNESCKESLLHGDRLMVVDVLYNNLQDLWGESNCQSKSSQVYVWFLFLGVYLCYFEIVLWFKFLTHTPTGMHLTTEVWVQGQVVAILSECL